MVWVKAIVDPKLYLKVPGGIIRLWGHDFIIQTDGSLCMQMSPDFVAAEVRAGRIKELSSPPPGKEPEQIAEKITIIQPKVPDGLTMDIGNYYGAGDLNKLLVTVKELTAKAIVKFSADRFPDKKKLTLSMGKDDMLDKIRSYIDSTLVSVTKDD